MLLSQGRGEHGTSHLLALNPTCCDCLNASLSLRGNSLLPSKGDHAYRNLALVLHTIVFLHAGRSALSHGPCLPRDWPAAQHKCKQTPSPSVVTAPILRSASSVCQLSASRYLPPAGTAYQVPRVSPQAKPHSLSRRDAGRPSQESLPPEPFLTRCLRDHTCAFARMCAC